MTIDPSARSGAPRPRRFGLPLHIAAPLGIGLVTVVMVAWSGFTAFKPVPRVDVGRVLPIALNQDPAGEDDPSEQSTEPVGQTVQAPGWIEPDPYSIAAAALADGIVEEILVLEGQPVEEGQVVARLVSEDAVLDLAEAESALALAEADVRMAEAQLEAARADWADPVELDRAIAITRAEIDELKARIEQLPSIVSEARANLRAKEQEAERVRTASEAGSASPIELIIAESAAEAQRSLVESLDRQGAILRAQRSRARAELEAATRNAELRVSDRLALRSAEAGVASAAARLERARAARDTAQLRVDRMEVRSPVSGLVQRRLKSPGDKVMRGMDDPGSAQILIVYDPRRLQVRADVPLADAAHVSVGQRCEVFCEVLPNTVFAGEVTRITNEADLQRNTLEIKVRIIDPSPMLKPEMLTRVRFLAGGERSTSQATDGTEPDGKYRIPAAALRDGDRVLVVRNRSGLRGRIESLGVRPDPDEVGGDGWKIIQGGLRPTDLVVLGSADLEEGVLVEMNPDDSTNPERGQS